VEKTSTTVSPTTLSRRSVLSVPAHGSRSFCQDLQYSAVPWSPLTKFFATRRLTRVACTRSSSSVVSFAYPVLSN
jgi:hypothetical protein